MDGQSGFDLETFIQDARAAAGAEDARAQIRALMEETVSDIGAVAAAMPALAGDEDAAVLYEDDSVSIWHARFAVGSHVPAHDHRMTATIAVYQGAERNEMWRSDGQGGLERSSEVIVGPGQVYQIGPSAIHSVSCASEVDCLGIHVYLGKLSTVERSLFDVETGEAIPFTTENYRRMTSA